MPTFATYLHPQTCHTSKAVDQIQFAGHSLPHFSRVREELEQALSDHATLPLRRAPFNEYRRVHTAEYLQALSLLASDEQLPESPKLSIECAGLEYCLPGYQYSLGGMLEAVDQMERGVLDRAYCFSLGGHHAYADWGHGYCLLNPMAATARYAQDHGFRRVIIIDWDHHHGDGTQAIFAHDPSVYCFNIHSAADLYMASVGVLKYGTTTMAEEVGHCNIPVLDQTFSIEEIKSIGLSGRFYRGQESLAAFRAALEAIPWPPDLILVFSGYDAHKDDCGSGVADWINEDFKLLTQYVLELSKKSSCPVLSVHAGGYQLPVTISAAVSHVEVLAGK